MLLANPFTGVVINANPEGCNQYTGSGCSGTPTNSRSKELLTFLGSSSGRNVYDDLRSFDPSYEPVTEALTKAGYILPTGRLSEKGIILARKSVDDFYKIHSRKLSKPTQHPTLEDELERQHGSSRFKRTKISRVTRTPPRKPGLD